MKVSDFYGVETPHSLSAVENALAPSASHSNFWRFGGFISEFWNCALQLQGHTVSYCGISFTELLSVSPTNAPTLHLVMGSPVNQIRTFKATFFPIHRYPNHGTCQVVSLGKRQQQYSECSPPLLLCIHLRAPMGDGGVDLSSACREFRSSGLAIGLACQR